MKNRVIILVCGLLCLVGMTMANYRYAIQNPGGTDFMIRWLGTRLLLTNGTNPYGAEATADIQRMFYGHLAGSNEDQLLFVYPLYSIGIFAPFALIPDYHLARAAWMTGLQLSIIFTVGISLSLSRWILRMAPLALLLAFSLTWYYGLRSIINGNIAVLVGLFMAIAFLTIRQGRDTIAGIMLALSTVKPPVVVLVLIFIMLWAVSARRWRLIISFIGAMILLTAGTMLLVSNWIQLNLTQVLAYPGYAPPGTPRAIFAEWLPGAGNLSGWVLTSLLAVLLLWEWYQAWDRPFEHFFWTACLTLVVTNLIGVQTATENYMAMYPALILIFASWDQEWGKFGRGLVVLSCLLLLFGVWWLFLFTVQMGEQPIQSPIMFFPLPVFLLIGLYWIRWWVLRPERPLLEQLRARSREIE